jgi:hypothetical protein
MLVEKKMRWTLGGKFELPTWFITPSYMVLDITHFLICSKQLPPFFGYVVDFVVPRFKIPLHGYQVGLGLFTKNGIQ